MYLTMLLSKIQICCRWCFYLNPYYSVRITPKRYSIVWLLMPSFLVSPGHQQRRYKHIWVFSKFTQIFTFIFNPKSYFGEFQNSFFLDELCNCVKLHTSENLDFAILSRPQWFISLCNLKGPFPLYHCITTAAVFIWPKPQNSHSHRYIYIYIYIYICIFALLTTDIGTSSAVQRYLKMTSSFVI